MPCEAAPGHEDERCGFFLCNTADFACRVAFPDNNRNVQVFPADCIAEREKFALFFMECRIAGGAGVFRDNMEKDNFRDCMKPGRPIHMPRGRTKRMTQV